MISGVVLKEHPYVLKDDRTSPLVEQTVFYIMPKTVRTTNETAAKYAAVSQTDRKGVTKVNVAQMTAVDIDVWLKAVTKIENYFCPVGAPEEAYDYFANKLPAGVEANAFVAKLTRNDGKGEMHGILVKQVTEDEDRKMIFLSMSPEHTEEVMSAFYNYSTLREGLKNG